LEANLSALAAGGRVMVIGLMGGAKGTIDLGRMLQKRQGVIATNLRGRSGADKALIVDQVRREVWPLLESGQLNPPVGARFPIADASQAHQTMLAGQTVGKIILDWS
jgi:NADPH:quinone reductase-like Zn-dependent oxidoreductase